jgi:murein DD-endopeptidase / murein LD-carboxypeptidase
MATSEPDSARNKPDAIKLFFAQYGINTDSVNNPDLFAQVYFWKGTRYQYAGHSLKGIDCSGFVAEMYRTSYCIALAGGSKDLYGQVDTVGRANLREGDILFFKIRKGQVSHVGIYLGNNKFAHASVHSGVVISDLDEAYYKKYYFTAGRLKAPKVIE